MTNNDAAGRTPERRCIDCGEGLATTTADDVCDRCRVAARKRLNNAANMIEAALQDAWQDGHDTARTAKATGDVFHEFSLGELETIVGWYGLIAEELGDLLMDQDRELAAKVREYIAAMQAARTEGTRQHAAESVDARVDAGDAAAMNRKDVG